MKSNTVEKIKDRKASKVRVDPSLNKYSNMILFPVKYEKAKQAFEKFGFPKPEDFSR